MKTLNKYKQPGLRSNAPFFRVMSIGIIAAGLLSQARAETVDSELVLLVDVTRPDLSPSEFTRLMDGYASAFTTNTILDSIQSGAAGRIAVSMRFFGSAASQFIAIPWMTIGNATQAQQFATLARSVTQPFLGASNVATALTSATQSFGTETGGTSNGFESKLQIIEVASATDPAAWSAGATATSSANARAAGVDLINALSLGNQSAAISNFYTTNVVGSTISGVTATSGTTRLNGTLSPALSALLTETVQTGATVSVTVIPEPSSTLLSLIPAALLILRRRRY